MRFCARSFANTSEEAKAQEKLHLPTLVAELGPYAQREWDESASLTPETLPPAVRETLTARLRDFLDQNLEDA